MTDELTPEQESDIRRLLAGARHDEPIPAHVAARLDAVLGGLSADSVTDLAGVRHRRRNAGRLLLAAAAVVVGGVTMGQVIGNSNNSAGDSASTAEAGGVAEVPREANGDSAGDMSDEAAAQGAPEALSADQRLLAELNAPLSLNGDDFDAQVTTSLGGVRAARERAAAKDFDGVMMYSATSLFTCPDGDYGEGAKLPAYYDEQEAVLVLRRPVGGVQRVDLLRCGTAETLDSVDLPAP